MRSVVRIGSWVAMAAAVAAVVVGWTTAEPELDAEDAVEVAVGALAHAGHPGGTLAAEPVATTRTPKDSDVEVAVWSLAVTIGADEIEVEVQRDLGQIVYIDDNIGPDLTRRLLTDEQYARLAGYRDDLARDREVRRNVAATGAAALVAAVSALMLRSLPTVLAARPAPAPQPLEELISA